MTEAAAPALEPAPAEYIQIWSESFSQVVGQIKGSAVPSAISPAAPADLPPAAEGDLWAVVTSTGSLRGEMSLRLPPPTVLRMAQALMSEPDAPEVELTADHREAAVELLRQVAGVVATSAKARWGESQLRVELAAAPPSWQPAASFWLHAGEEGLAGLTMEFGLSAALVVELREKSETAKAAASAPPVPSSPSSPSIPAPDSAPGTGTRALDLLMDVQLGLTLRFGSRQMLLREVLDLNPGAVIELDRKVAEPVDLLLDGKLVARGEVVVINGDYGLRVTDVSPLEAGRTPS
ncbi:MAG: FliM/FliN family flagellar motor switch protein [Candidatus Sulfotelmatobacter sp.]